MLLNDRYIGLMSGTSVDGVDAVLADFANERVQTLAHAHLPFAPALREALQGLMQSGADEIERAGDASVALARVYADAVAAVIGKAGLQAKDVAAIGAHGQTIRHRPERGFTTQLNAPAHLSELTGISVVADFRSRDVAAGGQGAPLVPAFQTACRYAAHTTRRATCSPAPYQNHAPALRCRTLAKAAATASHSRCHQCSRRLSASRP